MKMALSGKIALSDVDGTIVRKSLVLNHAVTLHRDSIIDLGELPERWVKDIKNESLITALAEGYRDSIVGKTVEDIRVNEYIADVVADKSNFYSILGRLTTLRDAGVPVVLISGSPSYLVDRFAGNYGFKSAGSDYKMDSFGRFTGEVVGMFHGTAKRDYLTTLGLERYEDILAFGDTQSDAPLFESASYSVLVEPTAETHAALFSLVHEIVTV